MHEFSSETDTLTLQLPLWTIVDTAMLSTHGLPRAIAELGSPDQDRILPLFTTPVSANLLIERLPLFGKETLQLATPAELQSLLRVFQAIGGGHVAIDLSCSVGGEPTGPYYPISNLLDALNTETA
jgi:hypothetical protein